MATGSGYQITPQQRAFWSFEPIKNPVPPSARLAAWQRNAIDAFVLARLDEKKLVPSAHASKLTLIRRATFDLIGLPPTPQEIDAFLADQSPRLSQSIDRLLALPTTASAGAATGWTLCVTPIPPATLRLSDSPGMSATATTSSTPFNRDKPYDQFLREQIAGDLLPATADNQRSGNTSSPPATWRRPAASTSIRAGHASDDR